MGRAFLLLLLLPVVAACAACTDAPTTPSVNVPFSQTDLRLGTGAEAANSSVLNVNYTGWLYDANRPDNKGGVFDTSLGRTPLTFTVGASQVIDGWEQGVIGMKVGGLRRLVIPPSLAYGDARSGPIPPNATLIFEIELLSIQ